jgi:hypothetical protein
MRERLMGQVERIEPVQRDARRWHIDGYGSYIGADNGCWMFCKDLPLRDMMRVGQTCLMTFQSGAGTSVMEVTRLPDRGDCHVVDRLADTEP